MPNIKIEDCPYFVWRDGHARWSPGPKLRALGWKGRDLKDEAGAWLPFDQALAAARAINAETSAAPAAAAPIAPKGKTVGDLLEDYFASADYKRKPENTRNDYTWKADAIRFELRTKVERKAKKKKIATVFARAPAKAITPVEAKAFFEHLLPIRGLPMARGAIMVLSAAYAWARLSANWRLRDNPCHRLDLPKPLPRVRIATDTQIRALLAAADAMNLSSIGDAVITALLSGQREADVLALADAAGANRPLSERLRDGESIKVEQGKTGARVAIFAAPQLVARLAAAEPRRRALLAKFHDGVLPMRLPRELFIHEATGKPWVQSVFQHRYADVRRIAEEGLADEPATKARNDDYRAASLQVPAEPIWLLAPCPGVKDINFQDLRDTAITWLARAGCTLPEIASISGHSLKSIHTILKHYLQLDEVLGREAIAKLVEWIDKEGIKL